MRKDIFIHGIIPEHVELAYFCKFCDKKVKLGLSLDTLRNFAMLNPNGTLHECYGLTTHQAVRSLPLDIVIPKHSKGDERY